MWFFFIVGAICVVFGQLSGLEWKPGLLISSIILSDGFSGNMVADELLPLLLLSCFVDSLYFIVYLLDTLN